jgi:hypothetical protein
MAAVAVTVFNFHSCSKYEDNNGLSLRSKTGRLTGTWEVVKINGQSPSVYFANALNAYGYNVSTDIDMEWEIESNNDISNELSGTINISYGSYSYNTPINTADNGEWEWGTNKESIEVDWNTAGSVEFEIKKLTNSEMKLENESGVEYEFEKQ